jgi:hypothetical protein
MSCAPDETSYVIDDVIASTNVAIAVPILQLDLETWFKPLLKNLEYIK